MGAWSPDSKSHVAHMDGDDFYGSEQSHVVPFDIKESSTHKDAGVVRIEFVGEDGSTKILKNKTPLQPGEYGKKGGGPWLDLRAVSMSVESYEEASSCFSTG